MSIRIFGFGSIGRGLVHFLIQEGWNPHAIHVFDKSAEHKVLADELGVAFTQAHITELNYQEYVQAHCSPGDILLNLAVDISSACLLQETAQRGIHYLDTCVDPWDYEDPDGPEFGLVSNTRLRAEMLHIGEQLAGHGHTATSIMAHGANPGLITYFVKHGLEYLRNKFSIKVPGGDGPGYFARLACELGVRVVQVAEYDTQTDGVPYRPGEFHNTWSVDGFRSELLQAAELGLGDAENWEQLAHCVSYTGLARTICITGPAYTPGYAQRVKTWTPGSGPATGWLVSHHEAASVNALLRIVEQGEGGEFFCYSPTVYYAYQPCPKAQQAILELPHVEEQTPVIMKPTEGYDQLGALIMYDGSYGKGGIWTGSTLSVNQCTIPHNPPTTQQVTASISAAIDFILQNPNMGLLEAEDLPWVEMLNRISPYLGDVSTVETDWSPKSLRIQDFLVK